MEQDYRSATGCILDFFDLSLMGIPFVEDEIRPNDWLGLDCVDFVTHWPHLIEVRLRLLKIDGLTKVKKRETSEDSVLSTRADLKGLSEAGN